ncbi:hypothetical protein ABAC460_04035 [Asticcacaulis sp. AC460]|uniref:hypothetical protein n=1 Tax=Asticcacaulis sp. AC460 TaxID=1282360 RepID=UPI0003C3F6A0|nr:hypothetical protein [Asticcacaulis sp. AC460]ESQ92065.1 hypothetical protein ABAC460_04035 [Asticcacaulis sp. AC460]
MTDEALLEAPIDETQDASGDMALSDSLTLEASGEGVKLYSSPVLDRIRASD